MTTSITRLNTLEHRLAIATTPEETKPIEATAAAAMAWARENQNYELLVKAARVYVLARRRTTELVLPFIQHGGDRGKNQYAEWQGDSHATLPDFGFNNKQWNRRVRELEIPLEKIDEYFDEVIEKGWHPSLAGLVRHAKYDEPSTEEKERCPTCGRLL
jgi:hypothetical protein